MKQLIILVGILFLSFSESNGQVGLSEKLTNYITKTFWNLDALGIEPRTDVYILEVLNNYSKSQRVFYTVHSVCVDSSYVGYIVAASYTDKDHLGKMRLFFPISPNSYTEKYNIEIISRLDKEAKIYDTKFQTVDMLKIIPSIPEDKKRACIN